VAVIGDGIARHADVESHQPQAPPEIDVVVVGEERGVEPARLVIGAEGDGERGSVREERLGRSGELGPVRLAVVLLKALKLTVPARSRCVARPSSRPGGRALVLVVERRAGRATMSGSTMSLLRDGSRLSLRHARLVPP
jgi:hypothetical protein